MSRAPEKRPRNCAECRYDGGIHYSDDGTRSWPCPNRTAADSLAAAHKLTTEAHEKQAEAARQIVRDAAYAMREFDANMIRDVFTTAGITDRNVIGAAFTALSTCKEPVIEATGRRVQSTEGTTRSTICVWRSRVHRTGTAAAS